MGPGELADAAEALAGRHGAVVRIVRGDDLLAQNFPLIHAVGRAAARAPRLIDVSWGDPAARKVTLVGKGVCFDSGGLDIKSDSAMLLMKKDMGGAAAVLALAHMIMDRRLDMRLRVLIPAVENAISGAAMRPLDVVRSRKGLHVEIGNTDAEGRLILADTLALADEEAPELLIDIGTLTGAARVALGPDLPPFYTDDEQLAADVARHAAAENDPLWRLPLWRPYDQMLDSKVADLEQCRERRFCRLDHVRAVSQSLRVGREVLAAFRHLCLDAVGEVGTARGRRMSGGACALCAARRAPSRLTPGHRMTYDPRITPARPDVAAAHLKGQVEAARFVEGRDLEVIAAQAPLRRQPAPDAAFDTEALRGELVTVYEETGEGWCWGQLRSDGYVGWMPSEALRPPGPPATHRVAALRTLVYPGRSIKAPPVEALSFGCRVAVAAPPDALPRAGETSEAATVLTLLACGLYVPTRHLAPIESRSPTSSPSPSVSSAFPTCGAARPASDSTARAWCRSRSPLAASIARATATCRSAVSAATCSRPMSPGCSAAIWCSGPGMWRSRATTRHWFMPMRFTWRLRSNRSPMQSAASPPPEAGSPVSSGMAGHAGIDGHRHTYTTVIAE